MRALPSALVLLSAGAFALGGCKKAESSKAELTSAAESAVRVRTVPAVVAPMPDYLTLTGSFRASEESEVASSAAGKVTAALVERGQRVKKDEPLAVLDSRGANITATQAAAQTGLARAHLDQAQKECERVKSLFTTGAISQAELDRTTAQCETTQFSAAAAMAQQQNAQKVVGDAVVRAPFAGIVGERYVNLGQFVQPGMRVASVYNPDPLRLELTVPEANIGVVKIDAPVRFTVSAFPDKTFTGAVKFISPHVRPATRDLVIEAICPNPDALLRPGMFAVAQLAAAESDHTVVPKQAVKSDAVSTRVYVVVDKRIQERIVQTGGESGDRIVILAGVKPGELAVVDPGPDVRDGAAVQ